MENNIFRLMPGPVNTEKQIVSRHIPWANVVKMRQLYINHPGTPKVPTFAGPLTLKGLTVDRSSLESILNADPLINEVMIVFAVREQDMLDVESGTLPADDFDNQYFTTVLVGMIDGVAQTGNAHDYCEPCPSKCGNL